MNSKLRNLIITAAILPGVMGLGAVANAQPKIVRRAPIYVCRPMPARALFRHPHRNFDHKLTGADVQTIMSARLIMRGNRNLKVGKIEAITLNGHKNYRVDIVTQDGSLVKQIAVSAFNAKVHKLPS